MSDISETLRKLALVGNRIVVTKTASTWMQPGLGSAAKANPAPPRKDACAYFAPVDPLFLDTVAALSDEDPLVRANARKQLMVRPDQPQSCDAIMELCARLQLHDRHRENLRRHLNRVFSIDDLAGRYGKTFFRSDCSVSELAQQLGFSRLFRKPDIPYACLRLGEQLVLDGNPADREWARVLLEVAATSVHLEPRALASLMDIRASQFNPQDWLPIATRYGDCLDRFVMVKDEAYLSFIAQCQDVLAMIDLGDVLATPETQNGIATLRDAVVQRLQHLRWRRRKPSVQTRMDAAMLPR